MKELLTRRHFLGVSAAAIVLTLAGTEVGCDKVDPGKKRLANEISGLPNSPIKSLLADRVIPVFTTPPPQTITRGGVLFRVINSRVELGMLDLTQEKKLTESAYTIREPRENRVEQSFYPVAPASLWIPIGAILSPDEVSSYTQKIQGAPVTKIDFPSSKAIYEGISPFVSIKTVNPENYPTLKKQISDDEQFGFIVTACTALVYDLLIEETVNKMRQLRLATTIQAKGTDGKAQEVESVIQALTTISNNKGRAMAVISSASYLIALKAIGQESMLTSFDLGVTPHDILTNSFKWAIVWSQAQLLKPEANMQQIP